ncbi:MAG TPA: cation transporter [Nitrospiraceae bacterium]|nr:cation transporter [Nitrospiraceae bacterium]
MPAPTLDGLSGTSPRRNWYDIMSHSHTHDDHHGHGHVYRENAEGGKRGLLIALSITVVMMVAEVVGGLLSNSLALLSDAGHMLTDSLALALSFFAMTFAVMPATEKKTFGFYRLEILAALVNGTVLLIVSLFIIYHAYQRILAPQSVEGGLMFAVAVLGLLVNLVGGFFLLKHRKTNLNIRGAFLHIVGDALSSVGVIIGGIVIIYTGWYLIDPLLSILIAVAIIISAGALVMESVHILLESAPAHINIASVSAEIEKIEGVREAYHVHLWTITSGVYALSAHVVIDDQLVSGSRDILDKIRSILLDKFKVLHSTIQLECERCDMSPSCPLPSDVENHR